MMSEEIEDLECVSHFVTLFIFLGIDIELLDAQLVVAGYLRD